MFSINNILLHGPFGLVLQDAGLTLTVIDVAESEYPEGAMYLIVIRPSLGGLGFRA